MGPGQTQTCNSLAPGLLAACPVFSLGSMLRNEAVGSVLCSEDLGRAGQGRARL